MAISERATEAVAAAGQSDRSGLPRVLRTGRSVGRTLYDAETGALVGMVDTSALADFIARCVWRYSAALPLAAGERPIDSQVCAALNALYDEPRAATSDDSMTATYGDEGLDEVPDPLLVEAARSLPPEGATEGSGDYPVQSDPADELVWATRRLLDAQWDVAQALASVQAQRS